MNNTEHVRTYTHVYFSRLARKMRIAKSTGLLRKRQNRANRSSRRRVTITPTRNGRGGTGRATGFELTFTLTSTEGSVVQCLLRPRAILVSCSVRLFPELLTKVVHRYILLVVFKRSRVSHVKYAIINLPNRKYLLVRKHICLHNNFTTVNTANKHIL